MASHPAQQRPAARGPVALEPWIEEMEGMLAAIAAPPPDPHREAREILRRQEAEQLRQIDRMVNVCGVPDRHARRKLFGQLETCKAIEFVRRWSAKVPFGSMLVLSGSRGCGKTQALAGAVIDGPPRPYPYTLGGVWPEARRAQFVTARDLQRRGLFDDDFEKLQKASVLAIDDLGTEFNDEKGAFRAMINGLLDARYSGPYYTIISSNLPVRGNPKAADPRAREGFAERYGERLISRLEEPGCHFAWLNEKSFRTAAAAKERGTP